MQTGRGFTEINVQRGQFIFGRHKAESALDIDGSTIYKHIKKLEEWGNIKIESNSQYSIVTICKYDEYQTKDGEEEQPSNNKVTTNEQPSNSEGTQTRILKNDKNIKNDKKFIKPSIQEIKDYCLERKNTVSAEKFHDYYESNGWKVGRNNMRDWKAAIRTWERSNFETKNKQKSTTLANIDEVDHG